MVSVLREKFAHLNLTFSIGGQISFDVSDILLDNMVISYCSKKYVNRLQFRSLYRFSLKVGTKHTVLDTLIILAKSTSLVTKLTR